VTAWQSKTGHIYLDERIARYDGSTHSLCKRGHLYRKQSYCEECIPYENKENTHHSLRNNGKMNHYIL
jgi:hypothetical protein